jgi:O-antigen/teichoic acid export membrane protein
VINKYLDIALKQFAKIRSSRFFQVFFWDVLSKGADFALLPVYLKILSQEEYGYYTYIIYIVTTVSGIVKLGIDTAVSKMYYETDIVDRGKMLFSANSIWFAFFIALFSLCLFTGIDKIVFSNLINISESNYLKIRIFIFAFIFFNLIQNTINVFFVIDENALTYQKYNLMRTVIGNGIVISLILLFGHGNKANFRLSIEPIVFLVSFIPLILIFLKKMVFKFDALALKQGLRIGLPMAGTLFVGLVYNISDKYFLQKSDGYDTLAVYNLAIFLTLPISLIFSSFNTIWLPKFLQQKSSQTNFKMSNSYFFKLSVIYLFLLIFLEIGFFIGINFTQIGADYALLLYIFPFIFIGKIADNLIQLYNNFIICWGKTSFNFIVSGIFSILTLILNYIFIPMWGLNAAVVLLLIIALARLLVFFVFVKINVNSLA